MKLYSTSLYSLAYQYINLSERLCIFFCANEHFILLFATIYTVSLFVGNVVQENWRETWNRIGIRFILFTRISAPSRQVSETTNIRALL